jgi:glycine betaine/proline transport system ATP-binding protein
MNVKALREFRRHRISMVFQHYGLFPHKTVLGNIGYGLKIRGMGKEEVNATSEKWLDRVGLQGYGQSMPDQLSGGMQQRVGLARAFVTDADILLMDEPFSGLDPLIRRDMQDQVLEIQKVVKKTVLFITHDLEEAIKIGGQIAMLKDGELVQVDTPENIILNPVNEYVRAFTKGINKEGNRCFCNRCFCN